MERTRIQRCSVWGVVNVTPDSFSDGGAYLDPQRAVAHALKLIEQGADVVDIGGESTRPAGTTYGHGYQELNADREQDRVIPVLKALAKATGATLSIDTSKGAVAEAAVAAGAKIINDVSGGADPHLLDIAAKCPVDLVLMHNRRRGEVDAENTCYGDVTRDVIRELQHAVQRALDAGVKPARIWLDPGIGFAKTPKQSLILLNSLEDLLSLGYRVLVGASRKSFIAAASSRPASSDQRLGGSLAVALHAAAAGVHGVRVHDVFETRQALDTLNAIAGARSTSEASSLPTARSIPGAGSG